MSNWCVLDRAIDLRRLRAEFRRVRGRKVVRPSGYSFRENSMVSLYSHSGKSKTYLPVPEGKGFRPTELIRRTPATERLLRSLGGPLFAVRYSIIPPGSGLRFHRDPDVNPAFGVVRLHVPLTSFAGNGFIVEGERLAMPAGRAYFVDVSKVHAVVNGSRFDRVHLLVDVGLTRRLLRLFPGGFFGGDAAARGLRLFPAAGRRPRRRKIAAGSFRLPKSVVPGALLMRNGNLFSIGKRRGRDVLRCPDGQNFKIAPYDERWFYCPSIGPGFVLLPAKGSIRVECHGRLAPRPRSKPALRTVRGSFRFVPDHSMESVRPETSSRARSFSRPLKLRSQAME
jgi:hypothetical protein